MIPEEIDREVLVPIQTAATRLCSTEYLDQREQERIGNSLWEAAERLNELWPTEAR